MALVIIVACVLVLCTALQLQCIVAPGESLVEIFRRGIKEFLVEARSCERVNGHEWRRRGTISLSQGVPVLVREPGGSLKGLDTADAGAGVLAHQSFQQCLSRWAHLVPGLGCACKLEAKWRVG